MKSNIKATSKRSKIMISKDEIIHVAKLANIVITQKEQEIYSKDLSEVINYNINWLGRVNTSKIEPTAHAIGEKSVMRADSTTSGLNDIDALKNAPDKYSNFFKAKHIFGED